MKKRVWLEVTHIIGRHGQAMTGVGYYTNEIIKHLIKRSNKYDFKLFGNLFVTNQPPMLFSHTTIKLFRLFPGKIWNQLIKHHLMPTVNTLFGIKRDDIVVYFNYVRLPVKKNTRTITVIYDLTFVHFPQYVDKKNCRYLSEFVPLAIKNSDHIITISQHAKNDIMSTYKISSSQVSVVPPAIDLSFYKPIPKNECNRMIKSYNISKPYILFVGTIEPRKNIECLIDAYTQLSDELHSSYTLVLAGGKGWLDSEIRAKLEKVSKFDIIETGYVRESDKPALYSAASVLVLPSHFEGFGMTILEAMACGTPVIAANNSSMPEVVGDAGLLFDANKTEQLVKLLTDILTSRKLAVDLSKKGISRAKDYSWDNSIDLMMNVLDLLTSKDYDNRINS